MPRRAWSPTAAKRRPMSLDELSSALGPGRVIVAFSSATGRRLGVVSMPMRAAARLGGVDGAFVRGRGINAMLPIAGLRFAVEQRGGGGGVIGRRPDAPAASVR
jgi:hypothetical protein